jgi:hypothetical protein
MVNVGLITRVICKLKQLRVILLLKLCLSLRVIKLLFEIAGDVDRDQLVANV